MVQLRICSLVFTLKDLHVSLNLVPHYLHVTLFSCFKVFLSSAASEAMQSLARYSSLSLQSQVIVINTMKHVAVSFSLQHQASLLSQ